MKNQKRWKKVYYIIQISPFFQISGFTFSRRYAESVARQIHSLTGVPGRVVTFKRENLQKLRYEEAVPAMPTF